MHLEGEILTTNEEKESRRSASRVKLREGDLRFQGLKDVRPDTW